MPLDSFGGCPKGFAWTVDQAEDGQSGVRQRSERLGQAGPLGVVAIFVPPAVLDEMEAVFHLPMATNVVLKLTRRDRIGLQAGDKVPAFAGKNLTLRRTHFAIRTNADLATGNVQMLSDMLGVVEVDPKPTRFLIQPLFSVTSWAGLAGVSWKKQVSKASSMSGWFALTWNR
jgi:hypothetical protein